MKLGRETNHITRNGIYPCLLGHHHYWRHLLLWQAPMIFGSVILPRPDTGNDEPGPNFDHPSGTSQRLSERGGWARIPSSPTCNGGGSCLCILQFGSRSTDVWGRPPLPLPLLFLSAWPSPARVSAAPTWEGGGLHQGPSCSPGPFPNPGIALALPGEEHQEMVSWALHLY